MATIGLAAPLPAETVPLDPSALLANHIVGGPGYSRLLGSLRNGSGYAYDAGARMELRPRGGLFLARSAVRAENAGPALRLLVNEIESLRRAPSPDEMARARVSLARGLLAGWFETNRSAARTLAEWASLGLDGAAIGERLRGIASADGEAVARFARERLQADGFVLIVVGDAEALADPLEDLGFGPPEVWQRAP
jgi:predicted Zn-dependent peptidase